MCVGTFTFSLCSVDRRWGDMSGMQGECLQPALVGKFYDQQSFTDVTF